MTRLSIIIPVYNVARYLEQSLDSLLTQKEADQCEIILINDGSTDESPDILRRYERKYPNLKIIDKANQGVSATRNLGLDKATGEYVTFMDADDILHPASLSIILTTLSQQDPDLLTWEYTTFYSKPKFAEYSDIITTQPDGNPQEAFNTLMVKGHAVSLWTKAIRQSLIAETVRFDETMTYGEDMFFSWKCFLSARRIIHISHPLYYYRQTGNSAVSRFHPDVYEKYARSFENIEQFAEMKGLLTDRMRGDIDYHFACRLPALTSMEARAPYSRERKEERISTFLKDPRISRALTDDPRLTTPFYELARKSDVTTLLSQARLNMLKARLLFPLKRLLK